MAITHFDPQRTIVRIQQVEGQPGIYNLYVSNARDVDEELVIAEESYTVVDQVREALYGHRAGVAGELLDVADGILQRRQEPR